MSHCIGIQVHLNWIITLITDKRKISHKKHHHAFATKLESHHCPSSSISTPPGLKARNFGIDDPPTQEFNVTTKSHIFLPYQSPFLQRLNKSRTRDIIVSAASTRLTITIARSVLSPANPEDLHLSSSKIDQVAVDRFHFEMNKTTSKMKGNAAIEADLPCVSDSVEVLWELENDSLFWWKAEVLEICIVEGARVKAHATIFYQAHMQYSSQTSDVEFLSGQVVRCRSSSSNRVSQPANSWRPITNIDDESDQGGEEWTATKSSKMVERLRNGGSNVTLKPSNRMGARKGLAKSPELIDSRVSKAVTTAKSLNSANKTIEDHSLQINALQDTMSTYIRRLCSVEKRLLSNRLDSLQYDNGRSTTALKRFLRRAILRELQKPMKRSTIGTGFVDGGQSIGSISAGVDCTQKEFSSITSEICALSAKTSFSRLFKLWRWGRLLQNDSRLYSRRWRCSAHG